PGSLTITTGANLPPATAGAPYTATLTATGGTPPYTWSASGILPAGFTLGSTGILTGTPPSAGTFTLAATVTDAANANATQSFSLNVLSSSTSLTITNTSFPNGVVGQPYQQPLNTACSSV